MLQGRLLAMVTELNTLILKPDISSVLYVLSLVQNHHLLHLSAGIYCLNEVAITYV